MKIRFLVHDVFGPGGGVLTVTLALAQELAQRHDVELVSTFGSEPSVHALPTGVTVRRLVDPDASGGSALRRRLRSWARSRPSRIIPEAEHRYAQYSLYSDLVLLRYLRSVRDGVLITMQPGLNVASARLGRKRYVRIAQDHVPFQARPRQVLESYRRYAGNLDMFLTLTKPDAKRFRKLLDGQVPVRAMGNGAPEHAGTLSDLTSRTVVAAGRLSRIKGFDLLIDAWAEVAEVHPDWQLQIWGEGGLRDELTQQIADLGLSGKVHLMGFSNQLVTEMSRASLFVLSSRAEGYGMVILEAMSCGLPVVSTDCPSGPAAIITSGTTGILVPNQDSAGLAAAINQVIEMGPEGRREMGRAALARTRELSRPAVARRWERLIADLSRR